MTALFMAVGIAVIVAFIIFHMSGMDEFEGFHTENYVCSSEDYDNSDRVPAKK